MSETLIASDPSLAWGVKIGDEQLVLYPGLVTVAQAQALRVQSHGAWTIPKLYDAIAGGAGPEEITAIVFLARRQTMTITAVSGGAPRPVSYDAVVAEIDELIVSGTVIAIDFEYEDDSPEG